MILKKTQFIKQVNDDVKKIFVKRKSTKDKQKLNNNIDVDTNITLL